MASPFQLAGPGRERARLDAAIRDYFEKLLTYQEEIQRWETYGRILTRPEPPEVPRYLDLWFELQRWPGVLLVEGGLLDQPAWTWHMVDLAGRIWKDLTDQKRATLGESNE